MQSACVSHIGILKYRTKTTIQYCFSEEEQALYGTQATFKKKTVKNLAKLTGGGKFGPNFQPNNIMNKNTLKYLLIISLAIVACSKEEKKTFTVSPTSMMLYPGDQNQIKSSSDNVTYTSYDTFYAEVSETGIVTANKVGASLITATSGKQSANVAVVILPKYILYTNMDKIIGMAEEEVLAEIDKDGHAHEATTNKLGNDLWVYNDYNTYVSKIKIAFDEDKKAEGVGVGVYSKYVSDLSGYLVERYTYVYKSGSTFLFLNHDEDVSIIMEVASSGLSVLYNPYEKESSTKSLLEETDCLDELLP